MHETIARHIFQITYANSRTDDPRSAAHVPVYLLEIWTTETSSFDKIIERNMINRWIKAQSHSV